MSDATTIKMIDAFFQNAEPTGFFAGMFKAPRRNFHNSEEVEIDIVRETEYVAVPVQGGHGYRVVTLDQFTNKRFKPPIYKEEAPIRSDDLYSREPGVDPFADQAFQAKLNARVIRNSDALMRSIQRAIELQCSQVLQTGTITLNDEDGNTQYTLDFGLAATHKITVGTAWDQAGADPLGDIDSALEVIRDDGKVDGNQVIMDIEAWTAFIQNTDVLAVFDNRRIDQGSLNPMPGMGGTGGGNYRGTIDVGHYKVDIWTYGGRYKDPETGNITNYITRGNVIVRSSAQRLDLTFGSIPLIARPDSRVARYLPRRMSSVDRRMDLFINTWVDNMGETLHVGVGSRPLAIPTQIDGYAVLSGTVT